MLTRRHLLRPLQRGVSLIEALVALAVMAFGVLGVVGVQLTLRANADIAKQRAEAVRIAQERIEQWRSFTTLSSTPALPTGHTMAYDMVATTSPATLTVADTNATYTVTLTAPATPAGLPPVKSVQAKVEWVDRNGATQSVVLISRIAGILPEISGALSVSSKSLLNRQIQNRNSVIPVSATDIGGGESSFSPPGGGSLTWVFNNTTGLITRICPAGPGSCTSIDAALLAGYVSFATTGASASAWSAEFPVDPVPTGITQVLVNVTAPTTSTVTCFQQPTAAYVAYYCAIPLSTTPPQTWAGRSVLDSTLMPISPLAGVSSSQYRVCRYTPDPTTDTPAPAPNNAAHPLDYAAVGKSLVNQNFVVIPGGDGSTAFICPTDDASTVFTDGDTRAHQPPN